MLLDPAYAVQQCNYKKGNNDKYIEKMRVVQHWSKWSEMEQDPELESDPNLN